MVLCDMGCEFYCYASDITNSFPAKPWAEWTGLVCMTCGLAWEV